jgi:hypothetical protein
VKYEEQVVELKGPLVVLYDIEGRDKHGPLQALVNGLIVYKGV